MTKLHGEMEDIQKRTNAMELEVPIVFKMNVHIPPQAKATQASLVPDSSATSEAMECVSLESLATNLLCDVSEDSASLLGEDDHQEDDGKCLIWLLIYTAA